MLSTREADLSCTLVMQFMWFPVCRLVHSLLSEAMPIQEKDRLVQRTSSLADKEEVLNQRQAKVEEEEDELEQAKLLAATDWETAQYNLKRKREEPMN